MSSAATIAIPAGITPNPIHALGLDRALREIPSRTTSAIEPTIFVVEDDIYIRQRLELLIRSQGWQPHTCDSAQELLARPRPSAPCALILAFSSMDSSCLEIQKLIARECADMPIIIVADYEHIPTTVQAMKAGAIDFLLKPFSEKQLVAAICQSLVRSRAALDRGAEMRDLRNSYTSLTPREQQVMALIVTGLLNKQVGGELGISEITVKAHRGQVMQKMKAASFAHLVHMASRLRITRYINPSALSA